MCLKLENGAVLFSSQDMRRLRSRAAGAMGSAKWVGAARDGGETDSGQPVPGQEGTAGRSSVALGGK